MKKVLLLLCAFTFSLAAFFYLASHRVYVGIVAWKLHPLTYESIDWEDGGVTVRQLRWGRGDEFGRIDAIRFIPKHHLKSRTLGGEILVEGLRLCLEKPPEEEIVLPALVQLPFFDWHFRTLIEDAKLCLGERQLILHVDHTINHGKTEGVLYLTSEEGLRLVEMDYGGGSGGKARLQGKISSERFSSIACWVAPFLPSPLSMWEWKKGGVKGELTICLDGGRLHELQCDLIANQVSLHSPEGIVGRVERIQSHLQFEHSRGVFSGEVEVGNGTFELANGDSSVHFDTLHASGEVRDGLCVSSLVDVRGRDIDGAFAFDWTKEYEVAHLALETNLGALLPFFEGRWSGERRGAISLDAAICRAGSGLVLEGEALILGQSLLFGSTLHPETEKIEANMVVSLARQLGFTQAPSIWIRSEQVNVEQFVTPWLFSDPTLRLGGCVDLEMEWKGSSVDCVYTGSLFFESPNLRLTSGKRIQGQHRLDRVKKTHFGRLPLSSASYHQKNLGLDFKECSACILFDGPVIEIQNLLTNWEGVELEGGMTWAPCEGGYGLDASSLHIRGPLDVQQRLFHHFGTSGIDASSFSKIDCDALFNFNVQFTPLPNVVKADARGRMTGQIDCLPFPLSAIEVAFEYRPLETTFEFFEGKGCISGFEEELDLRLTKLHFATLPNLDAHLDCSLVRSGKEALRFAGFYQGDFELDCSKSHLLGIHPTLCEESYAFETNLDKGGELARLLADLHLFPYDQAVILDALHLSGDLTYSIGKDWEGLTVALKSPAVFAGSHSLGPLELLSSYRPSHLLVNQFNLGDFSAYLDLAIDEDSFDIRLLELHAPSLVHMAVSGRWLPLTRQFQSDVSAVEFDLLSLSELLPLPSDLSCWINEESPKAGLRFDEGTLSLLSDQRLLIDGSRLEIRDQSDQFALASFSLHRIEVALPLQGVSLGPVTFSLDTETIPSLQAFPFLNQLLANFSPRGGKIEGEFSLFLEEEDHRLLLSLFDGPYQVYGHEVELKGMSLCRTPGKWDCEGKFSFGGPFLQLALAEEATSRSLELVDETEGMLTASWEKGESWFLQSIIGTCGGVRFDLEGARHHQTDHLFGKVELQTSQYVSYLPPKMRSLLERFRVGGGYTLLGQLFLPTAETVMQFHGAILGKDFSLGGVEFSSLQADFDYRQGQLLVRELDLKDPSGRWQVEKLDLVRAHDCWHLKVPTLRATHIRPNRIFGRKTKERAAMHRTLFVPSFELHNFGGVLGVPESFVGEGSLRFSNFPRRGFVDNILMIPGDIIARIGLDLTLLVPVRGGIEYEIRDRAVHLTDFREVYSDQKRSRFFLAEGCDSMIDFQGNLDLKIKMKQYNLLMKIVELFTMNIGGTVQKPSYSFARDASSLSPTLSALQPS